MATSGTYDFSLTANDIINEALEDLGVIVPGGTPASAITTSALQRLNVITKALSTRGIRVWSVDWVTKTFSAPSEVTGTDGNVYTCIKGHTGAAASRPITGADYTSYWYQTGDTGGVWVNATAYTTPGDFDADAQTLDIVQANIRYNDTVTPVRRITMQEYFNISDKWRCGTPAYIAFDKLLTGHIYLHPQPDFSDYADYVLHYLRESKLEDFDLVTNDPDFNAVYLDYLIKALRYALSPKFKKTLQEQAFFKSEMDEAFRYLKKEEAPTSSGSSITPSFRLPGRR